MKTVLKRYWVQFTTSLFIVLVTVAIITFWYQAHTLPEMIMAEQILELKSAFEDINKTAGIASFKHQQNHIDFLNVTSFEGSELGAMNLVHPEKWNGPYFKENPTMQEKYYQVVHTNHGYFIVPGNGVKLSNGKIIGKDIVFTDHADILAMTRDAEQLMIDNKPLAAPITVGKEQQKPPLTPDTNVE